MNIDQLSDLIRDVPDFPKPGIVFKDITPLLSHAAGFASTIELMAERIRPYAPRSLLAIESRGFLFAAPLAVHLGLPLHLIRKEGKLPWESVGISYELEYGSDKLEMHVDAVEPGMPYALVDDLMATGGTAAAAARLVERHGGNIACFAFVIELDFLGGRARLGDRPIESLIHYT